MHTSTKWLVAMIVLIFFMPALASILPKASREEFALLHDFYKSLHILGAVLFLGNIIITGVWMAVAEKSKDSKVLQFATKAVNWMDVFFTAPGAALILLTGLIQAPHHGGVYKESWILAGLVLFSLSGLVWILLLVPAQDKLIKLSVNPNKKFYETLHRWYFWGIIAIILPLISLLMMVFKPKLW